MYFASFLLFIIRFVDFFALSTIRPAAGGLAPAGHRCAGPGRPAGDRWGPGKRAAAGKRAGGRATVQRTEKLQSYRRPRTGGWAANGGIRREGGGRATGAQPAASGRAAGKRAGGQAGRKAGGGWKAAGPGWVWGTAKNERPLLKF